MGDLVKLTSMGKVWIFPETAQWVYITEWMNYCSRIPSTSEVGSRKTSCHFIRNQDNLEWTGIWVIWPNAELKS